MNFFVAQTFIRGWPFFISAGSKNLWNFSTRQIIIYILKYNFINKIKFVKPLIVIIYIASYMLGSNAVLISLIYPCPSFPDGPVESKKPSPWQFNLILVSAPVAGVRGSHKYKLLPLFYLNFICNLTSRREEKLDNNYGIFMGICLDFNGSC